ncbi:MAG: hypothetical protein OET44_18020, partial [Gammaproteobacteria bacterium]|nr:hypothetical protein [Gammaproteobacteria bacterium]
MSAAFISARDFLQAATILMMVPTALFVPKRRWPRSCRRISAVGRAVRIKQVAEIAEMLAGFDTSGVDAQAGYRQCLEMYFENRLHIVDQNLFNRWQPDIGLTGREHIDNALAAGRGAILWVSPFAFSDLIVKIALSQGGYDIDHLSRPEHGFSVTKAGIATLNRMRTSIEDR